MKYNTHISNASTAATELSSWEDVDFLELEDRRKYPSEYAIQASALDCPMNTSPIPWDHYEKADNLLSIFEGVVDYPFPGPSIGTSSTSSPSEICGSNTYTFSPAPSSRSNAALGHSYEGAHSLAEAARERCVAAQHVDAFRAESPPVSSVSSATTRCKPGMDYIRRAQERIKNQQPTRRPRLQDLVNKQAEDLAAVISSSIYNPRPKDDTDMMMTLSIRPHSRMMWSSRWEIGNAETEGASWVVHAPSAVRILGLGVGGYSS